MEKNNDILTQCPVAATVDLIKSKWKVLIIWNLLNQPKRYSELKNSIKGISKKILTDSLRSMEDDGIIIRTVYEDITPRVEYSLSELGEAMRPLLKSMEKFGLHYQKHKTNEHSKNTQ